MDIYELLLYYLPYGIMETWIFILLIIYFIMRLKAEFWARPRLEELKRVQKRNQELLEKIEYNTRMNLPPMYQK